MTVDPKLKLHIDAYSPETIPMARLAEYLADLAALFGAQHRVFFEGLERGSLGIVSRVAREDAPKVAARLRDIGRGNHDSETAKLFARIDDRLACDNAVGSIVELDEHGNATAQILTFRGRSRPNRPSHGPFTQNGHLDGVLIAVGGRDETVHLRLQSGDTVYSNLDTTRMMARELGRHLFEPVRVQGAGRWLRNADGRWTLLRFRVRSYVLLDAGSLRDAVASLRAVAGSGWREIDDPLAELDDLRRDDDAAVR
jgi:hypothetical protein